MTEKPPWRQALEQFERTIGAPMEEYVKTDEFADLAAKAAKSQTQMEGQLAAGTTQFLHSMNLPAASDIAELRAEIQALRAEVRALAGASATAAGATTPRPKPKPEPKPKPAAKPEPKAKPGPAAKPEPKPKPKPA